MLGKQRYVGGHIPSMPYADAPAYYRALCKQKWMFCLAPRFLMLTARTGEIRFARHSDIENSVLVIPPAHTKTGSEHRIPLTHEACRVLEAAQIAPDQEFLFPSPRGKPMSDATLSRHEEREGHEFRPHGFRATFRTWAEEQTDAEFEVKETILGHKVGSKVGRAYQRSDLLQKRSALLQKWNEFLTTV
jgi:integrase